jgi:hypothetical protein
LGEEEGVGIGEESKQPIGGGGVVDRSRVSPCPTRVGKECDPNEMSSLPLLVGPARARPHPSWTYSDKHEVKNK